MSESEHLTQEASSSMRCKFFIARGCGRRCSREVAGAAAGADYCAAHRATAAAYRKHAICPFDDIMLYATAATTPQELQTPRGFFGLCERFWSGLGETTRKLREMTRFFFSAEALRRIASAQGIRSPAILRNKERTIDAILGMNRRIWATFKNPAHLSALVALQKRWRQREPPPASPPPLNDTDPFTLEPIDTLEPSKIFRVPASEACGSGPAYAFDAESLAVYLKTPNPTNPYTREPFPDTIAEDLAEFMKKNGIARPITPPPESLWTTARDAFAYTLHYYERDNFYTNIDHFLRISLQDIVRVFYYFHENTNDQFLGVFMDLEACYAAIEISDARGPTGPLPLQFVFAKELLRMIQSECPTRFYAICNLFLSIATVSTPFRRALPPWVAAGSIVPPR